MGDPAVLGAARALNDAANDTGYALQARCFEEFVGLFLGLDLPPDDAWTGSPEPVRRKWRSQMSQLIAACSFLATRVEEPVENLDALRNRVERLQCDRARLVDERRELERRIGLETTDVEQLREEVSLLRELLELAALRRELHAAAPISTGRRDANRRLAEHARHNKEALREIVVRIDELERQREDLLRDNLEQSEQLWRIATERLQ